MAALLNRRNVLSFAAMSAAGMALAACSDSSDPAAEAAQTTSDNAATPAASPAASNVQAPPSQGSVDVEKLYQPGKLKDMVMGKDDAPVTIVEYASMTCPHCAHFDETTLPVIKQKYIDTGKARLIFREFPFDPRASAAFMLARCAPEDRYFPMIDVLFRQQQQWAAAANAEEPLMQIAKLAGFTQESFKACLTNQQLLDDVNASRERGENEFGVTSTPTFFINGKKYAGALSVDEMSAIIDGLL
ncbi:disulfide bond formation protein DsbA [Phyllobacterium phragmitis]|uniref:Disulfide bond formation protein DsbA n=1 Tax=Phyllobacterium phragmitis TaxID=2670329 RepID=A0A2S9IZ08_9HYPH|nr:DsbA family protein [Phyllobacterium phragmitis]PRD45738.1 disulfide bond formation protein DsbA [Phyllobacterium phragmitis]